MTCFYYFRHNFVKVYIWEFICLNTPRLSIHKYRKMGHATSSAIDMKRHSLKALYRIWCGVNRLGDSGVNRLGATSAFVNPAGQLLLTRWGKTRMDGVGIVFEFYTAPL